MGTLSTIRRVDRLLGRRPLRGCEWRREQQVQSWGWGLRTGWQTRPGAGEESEGKPLWAGGCALKLRVQSPLEPGQERDTACSARIPLGTVVGKCCGPEGRQDAGACRWGSPELPFAFSAERVPRRAAPGSSALAPSLSLPPSPSQFRSSGWPPLLLPKERFLTFPGGQSKHNRFSHHWK